MCKGIIELVSDGMHLTLAAYVVYCIHSYMLKRMESYGPLFQLKNSQLQESNE